jgi:hypothetical protein
MFYEVLHCLLHEDGQAPPSDDEVKDLLTKYSNNRLVGDIGNIKHNVTKDAKERGEHLYELLKRVLSDLDTFEQCSSHLIKKNTNQRNKSSQLATVESFRAAQKLLTSSSELHDFIPYVKNDDALGGTDHDSMDNRRVKSFRNNAIVASIISTIESVISLFDPPAHKSIFGLDVLRGTMLCRYAGAKQMWIPRPKSEGGGMIDVVHIPHDNGERKKRSNSQSIDKAVLFCNPNAGLCEVTTGISLIGGNVGIGGTPSSWTDFYTERGHDIFLFNYSGFGRSHVGKNMKVGKVKSTSALSILGRIMYDCIFGFKPKPSTLKADALAVALHMTKEFKIGNLIIHGESIGGMAASSAARRLSTEKLVDCHTATTKAYPTLLICDRTFCNLNAVATHLLGSWTSFVIPILIPFWNTDVAGDFIAATCKKVIAQDAADSIIHYSSSLEKGVATAKELKRGSTGGLDKALDTPLHYRMSDFENTNVLNSTFVKTNKSFHQLTAPVWPADKHFSIIEAFHFAACTRRIGKVATSIRKKLLSESSQNSVMGDNEEEGIEITEMFSRDLSEDEIDEDQRQMDESDNVILGVWETISRCDGLTGFPLGAAVKEGDECVIDWLSCLAIYGSQRVALEAEKRNKNSSDELNVKAIDFDIRFSPAQVSEKERLPTLPLPAVITLLYQLFQEKEEIIESK